MSTDNRFIPLSVPFLGGNEKAYVNECLDTNWISSVGKFVDEFENKFAEYTGSKHAVAVASGTAALHLALLVSGIKKNEEVFVPSLTFIAPINAVCYVGAIPTFIDSEEKSLGLSPAALKKFIQENCETKDSYLVNKKSGRKITAIIPVHLYGHSCHIRELSEIADEHKLTLIEDAAEAIGSLSDNKHAGTFGKLGCFSFNGNKTLTTGGGGMLVSDDHKLAEHARHLSTQAKADKFFYYHDETGYNYRMMNIQAAIGLAQLENVEKMIGRKRMIHKEYENAFCKIPDIKLFTEQKWCRSNYWFALIFVAPEKRDKLFKFLEERKIQTRPFWQLNHKHPMYSDCPRGNLDTVSKLYDTGVCLPCHPGMNDKDVARVINTVEEFCNE